MSDRAAVVVAGWRNRIIETRIVTDAELRANPKNWRRHPEVQAMALRGVLAAVGIVAPLIAYYSARAGGALTLIDGHLRLTTGGAWPCVILDVDDEEADLLLATFDPITAMAEMDKAALAELMATVDADAHKDNEGLYQLISQQFELSAAKEPLAEIEPQIDRAEELRQQWGTATGQLWQLGRHRLLCGDATDAATVGRVVGQDEPFMMVTDPPYGVEYDPKWRDALDAREDAFGKHKRVGVALGGDDRNDWSAAYQHFSGDVAYIWHASWFVGDAKAHLVACDFEPRTLIIWAKNHFAMSRGDYHWQHEPCWYAVKQGRKSRWCGDRTQSTLWEISSLNPAGRVEGRVSHATQKPLECMARPIRNHGAAGDVVYDPFVGSGTTLIACEQERRLCLAIERNAGYVAVTLQRWLDTMHTDPVLLEGAL